MFSNFFFRKSGRLMKTIFKNLWYSQTGHSGPGIIVSIATGYGAGRSGDQIPVGGKIFRT